jgi:lipopolysaccharide transport system permease protein
MRDILVRYKAALLGITWALIKPLLNMLIFVVIFHKVAELPADGTSYPLFVMCAMIPWQFISNTIQNSTTSLCNHSSLITKIYFPRMLLPFSSIIVNLIDLAVAYLIFFPWLLLSSGFTVEKLLFFPLFLLQLILLGTAISLWLSSLTIKFRDMLLITPFLTQIGLFLSPVGYRSDLFPQKWQWLYQLNPLVGLIDGFRYSLLGGALPNCLPSIAMTLLLLISGFFYFKHVEQTLADFL